MKKVIRVIILSCLLFFIPFVTMYAAEDEIPNINLAKTEIIDHDYFAAGNTVTVSGTVNGDAYVAGGNVTFDGVINGDLLIAGGNVTILGKVTGDVRAAGGNVIFSSQVDRNATLLGGSISMSDSGKVSGSLVSAGGNISVNSPVGKGANIAGGQISLGSMIGNDVNAYTEGLYLSPLTKITGDLNYWSEKELVINPEASISGKTLFHFAQTPPIDGQKMKPDVDKGKILGIVTAGSLLFGLYVLMIELLIGLLIIKLLPEFMKETTEVIGSRPLASLGLGLLVIMLMPIVFILLLITVIGIPIGFALILAMILYWIVSGTAIALFVGLKTQHYFGRQKTSLYWSYLVGLIIMTIIGLIPIINFLVGTVSFLIGTGALLIQKKHTYTVLREHKIV